MYDNVTGGKKDRWSEQSERKRLNKNTKTKNFHQSKAGKERKKGEIKELRRLGILT